MTAVDYSRYEDLRGNLNHLSHSPKSMTSDVVDYTDYRFEIARVGSFFNWTVPFMEPKKLAAAGFYYTGEKDTVKCFECKYFLSGWQQGDNPMTEHQRWSARCRFVRNIPCGNVPIGVDPKTIPSYSRGKDICGLYGLTYKPNSGPENNLNTEEGNKMSSNTNFPGKNPDTKIDVFFDAKSDTKSTVEVNDIIGVEYPKYTSYTERLQSFQSWPKEKSQKKEDMAAAGFFYSGVSDRTFCYYCGIGLINWEPSDNPINEHNKWASECPFIKSKKVQTKRQSTKNDDQCVPEAKTETDSLRESKTSDSS
ncbi:death-associated inhibitor of apoptosis 1 [Linepithema humile]|uniref:death-associated inhibitor of apoptosis 1 n=1 Tax=Linepithema humile TaxID=83485 RepID=UPI00351E82E0